MRTLAEGCPFTLVASVRALMAKRLTSDVTMYDVMVVVRPPVGSAMTWLPRGAMATLTVRPLRLSESDAPDG